MNKKDEEHKKKEDDLQKKVKELNLSKNLELKAPLKIKILA